MPAQPAEKVTSINKPRPELNVIIQGKLSQVDIVGQNKDIYRNVIVIPAPDEFSHPQRFCVMSNRRLGDKDQIVSVEAEVRCRPWKDNKGEFRYPHELWAVIQPA